MRFSSSSSLLFLLLLIVDAADTTNANISNDSSPPRNRRLLRHLESPSPSDGRPILEGHYASVTLGTGPGGCSGEQEAVLDIYPSSSSTATAADAAFPTVLLLPGGAYMNLNGDIIEDVGTQYIAANYTLAILYYRLPRSSTTQHWLVCSDPWEAASDVSAAMRHLHSNAAQYRIDPSQIVISGFSAGGHLAALHSSICEARMSCPRAQVLHFPFLESGAKIFCSDVGSAFANLEEFDSCFPTAMVDAATPPTILYHASGDAIVPTVQMTDFVSALDDQGTPYEYYEVSGGGHYLVPFREVAAISGGVLDENHGNYAMFIDRALALPAPTCARCDDIPTQWMMDNGKSCDDAAWHIDRKCAGDPTWNSKGYCRTSCYEAGRGYLGEMCCLASFPEEECTECSNDRTPWMVSNDETCETSPGTIETKCRDDDWWVNKNYCQQTCFDAGRGYDGISCCTNNGIFV